MDIEQENQTRTKRHLIYRCEIAGGQNYTARVVNTGCGKWTVHSTTRMTTPSYKDDQIRPWIAVCKYCGKKSRMRTRDEPNHEFATRDAAIVRASNLNAKIEREQRQMDRSGF